MTKHDNLTTLRDAALFARALCRTCRSRINRDYAAVAVQDFRQAMKARGASSARINRSLGYGMEGR